MKDNRMSIILFVVSFGLFSLTLFYSIDKLGEYNAKYEQYIHYVNTITDYDEILEGRIEDLHGRYFLDLQIFMVNGSDSDPKKIEVTAYHEFCHWLWYTHLSVKQRNDFTSIFNTTDFWVTDYAKKDVKEDFAESCSYWRLNKNLDLERTKFMENNVRGLLN